MCCYSFQIFWGLVFVSSSSFRGRCLSPFGHLEVSVAVLNRHSARQTSVSVEHLVDLRLWYQSKTFFIFRCLGWIWSDCRDRAHSLHYLTPWHRHLRSWAHLGSLFHRIGAELELALSGRQVAWSNDCAPSSALSRRRGFGSCFGGSRSCLSRSSPSASVVVLLHLRTCSWILDLNTATSIPGTAVIHLPWWWMISASPGSGWSSANWWL